MRLITTQSSNRLREKLCYIALDYDTVLTSTTESSDMIRPTYSQTETTLLSTNFIGEKASGFRDISFRYIMKCAVDIAGLYANVVLSVARLCSKGLWSA